MYAFFRTILITFLWLSLLIVPYALIAYACYAGLCGGPEAEEMRTKIGVQIWGYYIWLYPLIVFFCLYFSRKFAKGTIHSMVILVIPLICLLPAIYALSQERSISNKYRQQQAKYYSAQPNDFVCASGKFIRYDRSDPGHFYFFESQSHSYGVSWGVTYFYQYEELKNFLAANHIVIEQCKNQKGIPFHL
ncbi:Uncharacterised protein [Legionella lansingensis]|uniref:Uncharacterized protein n=1 Tax=Legionella lansingensis TaxID=45067 RepID=A0A0W0VM00_9GAMM|nr:hypothetical protein [Legionella lansingensis]KTD20809.1 hypothetical protein Llan_1766 [Legionella lansingensis]SNV49837.1 Uncharacterised protein [Legionella lansingensis]